MPVGGGVILALARMKTIHEINVRDRYAVVDPGVVNVWLTNALKPFGYHYAPDPSSQGACTIGGNVATNSGGPHTLKYGVTVNHILGCELVLPNGDVVTVGGPTEDPAGFDLIGAVVGNEGTFGIVTKVWVRLTRNPESVRTLLGIFDGVDDATNAISEIIASGIVPGALEMLDNLFIGSVEAAFKLGFPLDAGALLIMEVDGPAAGIQDEADRVEALAKANGAREVRKANTEAERLALWKARKAAFGTVGRLGYPSYCTQDGVVPRTKLPDIMRHIRAVSAKYEIGIANVFHAGDGNIHPVLLFDERDPVQIAEGHRREPRDPRRVRPPRRVGHGRARHRRGENRLHVRALYATRPRLHDPPPHGLQPEEQLQPDENAPHVGRLRGTAEFLFGEQARATGGGLNVS